MRLSRRSVLAAASTLFAIGVSAAAATGTVLGLALIARIIR